MIKGHFPSGQTELKQHIESLHTFYLSMERFVELAGRVGDKTDEVVAPLRELIESQIPEEGAIKGKDTLAQHFFTPAMTMDVEGEQQSVLKSEPWRFITVFTSGNNGMKLSDVMADLESAVDLPEPIKDEVYHLHNIFSEMGECAFDAHMAITVMLEDFSKAKMRRIEDLYALYREGAYNDDIKADIPELKKCPASLPTADGSLWGFDQFIKEFKSAMKSDIKSYGLDVQGPIADTQIVEP